MLPRKRKPSLGGRGTAARAHVRRPERAAVRRFQPNAAPAVLAGKAAVDEGISDLIIVYLGKR